MAPESDVIDYEAIRQTARDAVEQDVIDYEAIRQVANEIVPHQTASGVAITQLDGTGAESTLRLSATHLNHVGTAHAAVLFLVAEAAAGSAFVASLGSELGQVGFVAKEATIKYLKPATSDVRGECCVTEAAKGELAAARLAGRGSVELEAEVLDASQTVLATATFRYHLRYNTPAPREANTL